MSSLARLCLSLCLCSCSAPSAADATSVSDATAPSPTAALVELTPPTSGVQIHLGGVLDEPDAASAWTVAAGDEWLKCVDSGATHAALNVTDYEVQERPGIHHLTLLVGTAGDIRGITYPEKR